MKTQPCLKPWRNGDASWRKLTQVEDLGQLATSFGQGLCALALTCDDFGRDQICTQADASFSPFGHPTQVNASWVTSINLLLANKIEDSLPFLRLACTCEETCERLATQRKYLRKFNLRPLATTCGSVWPRLDKLNWINHLNGRGLWHLISAVWPILCACVHLHYSGSDSHGYLFLSCWGLPALLYRLKMFLPRTFWGFSLIFLQRNTEKFFWEFPGFPGIYC